MICLSKSKIIFRLNTYFIDKMHFLTIFNIFLGIFLIINKPEQLIKFIELCLTDGLITEKEREVIFRKAAEYNVDIDECEIILESMIQQKNMSKTVTILKNEIVTEVNTEINNSEKNSSLLSIYSNIYDLYSDDKYLECINEVKKAESLFKDLFKAFRTFQR